MKNRKIALFLLILTTFFMISSGRAMAEERSIFVGDLIEIRVTSQKTSIDELKDKFKDFEIVDIKEDTGSFLIILRSFEPGEKTVRLGDKEIKIVVKSTLNEVKRKDIFEGDLSPEKAGFYIHWQYIFYILLMIFLSTGGFNLWRYFKSKKVSSLSPHQRFMSQINHISLDEKDFFVKLTQSLKEYLESIYSCRIRGKTSSEIIKEIGCLPDLQAKLPAIQSWLCESDYFKFAGVSVSTEKKQKLSAELVDLVSKIEETKEGKS